MLNSKFIISLSVFISFLLITSVIKNKTRVIEKQISNLNTKIFLDKKNISEAQLDYNYLSSPLEIEKKLDIIGNNNYQPIDHSKLFLNISDFTNMDSKVSKLKIKDEKRLKKIKTLIKQVFISKII